MWRSSTRRTTKTRKRVNQRQTTRKTLALRHVMYRDIRYLARFALESSNRREALREYLGVHEIFVQRIIFLQVNLHVQTTTQCQQLLRLGRLSVLGDGLARSSGVAAYLPLGNWDNSYRPSPGHRDGLCGSTTRKICALHHPATLSRSGSGTCSVTEV